MFINNDSDDIVLKFRWKDKIVDYVHFGQISILSAMRDRVHFEEHVTLQDLGNPWGLDLRGMEVQRFFGPYNKKPRKVLGFLEKSPGYNGALLLYPGTGDLDIDAGFLIFLNKAQLEKVVPIMDAPPPPPPPPPKPLPTEEEIAAAAGSAAAAIAGCYGKR